MLLAHEEGQKCVCQGHKACIVGCELLLESLKIDAFRLVELEDVLLS